MGEKPVTVEGRKAAPLRRWEPLNPERLHYEVIFADAVSLPAKALHVIPAFLDKGFSGGLYPTLVGQSLIK